MRTLTLLLLGLFVACGRPEAPAPEAGPEPSYVVVVSFDGMRYDMLDRVPTPSFDRLEAAGVRATGLIPAYPTRTFPNHYTLATGMYPGHHGLVDNAFYDPAFDAMYRLGDDRTVRDGRWYGGEPIWVTAETQNVTTASFFWVGTEAEIKGVQPRYFKYYDGSFPYEARVDTALHWLTLPLEARPRLVMLYFDQPDYIAHGTGPDAPAVDSVVAELDGVLGRLLDGIQALPHGNAVDVIVLSDHGMAAVPDSQVVYLDDYVDLDGVRVMENTTQALLYFDGDEHRLRSVHEVLKDRLEHATAYLPKETPERWHYSDDPRIGDIIVAADPGWIIRRRGDGPWRGAATHGWDPYFRPMHGIFLAAGPGIRSGPVVPAFESVHVYPLIAHLLGLTPAPGIDGRLEVVMPLLREPALR